MYVRDRLNFKICWQGSLVLACVFLLKMEHWILDKWRKLVTLHFFFFLIRCVSDWYDECQEAAYGNMPSDLLHILNEMELISMMFTMRSVSRVLNSPCPLSSTWEVMHFFLSWGDFATAIFRWDSLAATEYTTRLQGLPYDPDTGPTVWSCYRTHRREICQASQILWTRAYHRGWKMSQDLSRKFYF